MIPMIQMSFTDFSDWDWRCGCRQRRRRGCLPRLDAVEGVVVQVVGEHPGRRRLVRRVGVEQTEAKERSHRSTLSLVSAVVNELY